MKNCNNNSRTATMVLFFFSSFLMFYHLQPVLSGVTACNLPGLRHDQRLWCDWLVWMVSLLQGVLRPQRAQGWAHSHPKGQPVPNRWRSGVSRAGGEGALQSPGRRSATLHCVSVVIQLKHTFPLICPSSLEIREMVTQNPQSLLTTVFTKNSFLTNCNL